MPLSYTGSARALQSPSGAPLPAAKPILSVPVGGDARNAASVQQMVKVCADYLAMMNTAARFRPAPAPRANGSGFSAVTQSTVSGIAPVGTGTVTPVDVGSSTFGWEEVRVKVSTAGAAGAGAFFRWSNDGGATYGGATALPAGNYTDATSGITVTFAGSFVLDEIYAFRPADSSQTSWYEDETTTAALANAGVDHLGLPSGLVGAWDEDWTIWPDAAVTTVGTGTIVPGYGRYTYDLTANAALAWVQDGLSEPRVNYVSLTSGTAAANRSALFGRSRLPVPPARGMVFSWVMGLESTIQNNGHDVRVGFGQASNPNSGINALYFRKLHGTTNWEACTKDNAGTTTTNTGVAPNASFWNHFRVELYGSMGKHQNCARFFVDDKLVAVHTANLPIGPLALAASNDYNTGGVTRGLYIGPTRVRWRLTQQTLKPR